MSKKESFTLKKPNAETTYKNLVVLFDENGNLRHPKEFKEDE